MYFLQCLFTVFVSKIMCVQEQVRQRELSLVVKDLSPQSVYYSRVQAYNAEGAGPLSETKSFSLRRGGKPKDTSVFWAVDSRALGKYAS